jgi:chemotaxis protein CheX
MSDSAVATKIFCSEDFLSPENKHRADATVTEVFSMMFGFQIEAVEGEDTDPPSASDERTAVVGFSGALRGSCQIRMSSLAAGSVASAMLGGMPVEDDDSLDDALGELCNMLAGGWKNAVSSLSSEVALSPPTVISGKDYKVHVHKPSDKLARTYRFDAHTIRLVLCREDSAQKA